MFLKRKNNIFLLILFIFLPTQLFSQPQIEYATSVAQGQLLEIKLTLSPVDNRNIHLQFLDKKTPCYLAQDPTHSFSPPNKGGEEWECLAGIPADSPIGEKSIGIFKNGKNIASKGIEILPTSYPTEPLTLSQEKKSLLSKKGRKKEVKKIHRAMDKASLTKEKFWSGAPQIPLEGKIESSYGERRILEGVLRKGYHRGVDIGAPEGTPILAMQDGQVLIAEEFSQEGKMVMVQHGQGIVSAYLHCSEILVSKNQKVKRGEILAKVGSTGVSNSPHLHFGVYIHGTPVDPLYFLKTQKIR